MVEQTHDKDALIDALMGKVSVLVQKNTDEIAEHGHVIEAWRKEARAWFEERISLVEPLQGGPKPPKPPKVARIATAYKKAIVRLEEMEGDTVTLPDEDEIVRLATGGY